MTAPRITSRTLASALLQLGDPGMTMLEEHGSPYAAEALAVHALAGGCDMDWVDIFSTVIRAMGWFFIVYSLLINPSFLVLTVFAVSDLAGYRRRLEYAATTSRSATPWHAGSRC